MLSLRLTLREVRVSILGIEGASDDSVWRQPKAAVDAHKVPGGGGRGLVMRKGRAGRVLGPWKWLEAAEGKLEAREQ